MSHLELNDDGSLPMWRDSEGKARPTSAVTEHFSAAGGAHPNLAAHTALGLAADDHTHAGVSHPDLTAHTDLGLAASHAHPYSADDHTHAAGDHPDLATHTSLGLAAEHAHPYSGTGHNHDVAYSAAGHNHDAAYSGPAHVHVHDHDGTYSASGHTHVLSDGDIPAGIARDAEVAAAYATIHGHPYEASGAVATHAAAADPHPGYLTVAEGDAAYAHAHPYEASGAVATHAAAADPHPTYATAAEVGHPHANDHARQHSITSTSDHTFPGGSTFLRADGTFANPPGGSEAFPVGSVFLSVVATNPATLLGYGTWAAFGAGRMLIGNDGATFGTDEQTGGSDTHTHAAHTGVINHTHPVTDPGHTHLTQRYPTATGSSSGFTIDTSMSGTPANNTLPTASATTGVTTANPAGGVASLTHDSPSHLPPYVVVHMWKRTA